MTAENSSVADDRDRAKSASTSLDNVTRDLQDALHALGAMAELQRVVREIPDARERLAYVGGMTEAAAHKVLNLVDGAQPSCREQTQRAQQLSETLERNAGDEALTLEHARRLLTLCAGFVSSTAAFADQQNSALSEIMLAQDFQDLSGQVIKKVIDMITRTEQQLVHILAESPGAAPAASSTVSPASAASKQASVALEGPQTPDNALAQDDVDDLLASMGF
jgi:chemotaxis protein CheZ